MEGQGLRGEGEGERESYDGGVLVSIENGYIGQQYQQWRDRETDTDRGRADIQQKGERDSQWQTNEKGKNIERKPENIRTRDEIDDIDGVEN